MKSRACFDKSFLKSMPETAAEWKVLFCLALHHNAERGAFPSVKTIIQITGISRATVFRTLKSLEEADQVISEVVGGKRVFYLPVDERNVLLGGSDRWIENPRSPICDEIAEQGQSHPCDSGVSSVNKTVSSVRQDVSSVRPGESQECDPLYNAPARFSEASLKDPLRVSYEATPQPGVAGAFSSSKDEGKEELETPSPTTLPETEEDVEANRARILEKIKDWKKE